LPRQLGALILREQEGWQNGYCTSLENWRPQGLGGSNPSPSVHYPELRRGNYWPGSLGAGPSRASLAFIVLNPESFDCRLFSCDAGTRLSIR